MRTSLRLVGLLLPHWRRVVLGIALSLLALAANVGLLALSSWFIAFMAIAGSLHYVVDYTLPAAGVRALALLRAAARYVERLFNHDTTLRILSALRVWFFRRIEPLAPARLSARRSGDLLSRIRADVDTLDDFYVRGVIPSAVALLAAAAVAAVLARFDPRLAAVALAGLACGGLLLPLALRALAERPGRQKISLAAELRASVVEEAQAMAELVALGAIADHQRALLATSRELERRQGRLGSLQGMGEAGMAAAASLSMWAALLLLLPLVQGGVLSDARLPMLVVLVLASFEAVMPLPAVIQKAGETSAAAGRLFELIDERPAVAEPARPALPPRTAGGGGVGISIRDLSFRYAPDQPWVLRDLSLRVQPGGHLAIVGPTGAGKSTLVSILMRFWEYEAGQILLSGLDGETAELRALTGAAARGFFSVMPQAPSLFHATLRENLQLAAPPGSDLSDGQMREALDAAGLGGLLASLPDGLGSVVGETGRELSVGEVRRVALARALLREAPAYILDEPTESLDEATADAVLAAAAGRLRGRTLLLITHRDRDLAIAEEVVRLGPPC